jgi:hypothetical protein
MTRVLYWNINNFSKNKILNDGDDPAYQMSQDRLAHIVDVLAGSTHNGAREPIDVVIIAECYARVREVGYQGGVTNADASVGFAILLLLEELRRSNQYWCLVPPMLVGNLGYRESVAVLYNAQNLQFTGPAVYSLGNGLRLSRRPQDILQNAVSEYPGGMSEALPGVMNPIPALNAIQRTWPAQFAGGGGPVALAERGWAAQVVQYAANGQPLLFPGADNRSPYLTRFWDPVGNRTLKIFSVHTSPDTATQAVNQMPLIDEVITVRNTEVSMVIGDFNVDAFDPNANGAYTGLDTDYTWLFDPRDAGAVWASRKPYLMTHMLPATVTNSVTHAVTQTAFPYNTVGVHPDVHHNVYPRFGYMGSWIANNYSDWGAIDTAFVRYGAGVVPPVSHRPTVVNTVVGTPYNAQPAPPHVTAELTGGRAYPQTLATAIPPAGLPAAGGDTINFSNWASFGKIRSTSDHLAILVDI